MENKVYKIIYFFALFFVFFSICYRIEAFSKLHFSNHKNEKKNNIVIKGYLACDRCSTIHLVIWEDQVNFLQCFELNRIDYVRDRLTKGSFFIFISRILSPSLKKKIHSYFTRTINNDVYLGSVDFSFDQIK